jgi:hypothetical protein
MASPTGHSLLHFQGYTCADCGRCPECKPLLDEEWRQRYGNEPYFVASDECSECGKVFSEHNSQEMKACTGRIIAKRNAP